MIRTAILALVAFSTTAPAFAERYDVAVSYADLDLSKAVGRATLDRRVAAAIREACASQTSGLVGFQQEQACKRTNLANIHRQLAMISGDRLLATR